MVQVLEAALQLAKGLGDFAADNQGIDHDTAPQQTLSEAVRDLGHGANNEPNKANGGNPAIALSGQAGVAITSPNSVTVAAGDPDDLLALVDRIDAALHGWRPAGTGWLAGPLRRPPGYEAPVLVDDTVSPERPYVPLQYVTTVHTT